MTVLAIKDLAASKELDRKEMTAVVGGEFLGLPNISILSPELFNKVTPITGIAEIPTVQTNNLLQSDVTHATNGNGINFVSNNKSAYQDNYNYVSGVNNPYVA
jgi:hypothetical protein